MLWSLAVGASFRGILLRGSGWSHAAASPLTASRSLTASAVGCSAMLTSKQKAFEGIQRGNFARVGAEAGCQHVKAFEEMIPGRVLTGEDDCDSYNEDWLGKFKGQSRVVLRPKTTEEVSKLLEYCNTHTIAVCPQGGNTGLVGGSVPLFDEVVLSLELMNNVISVDDTAGLVVCQAGCVLQQLNDTLAPHKLMMPLDLGAKGSCQIGGNIATNAGGLRLLRYGSLHGNVLGLEVVLADGTVLSHLSGLKKDNTGYDLKQLFVGSEGTLGVITAATIGLAPLPQSVNLAFLGCETYDELLSIFRASRHELGEVMSAFEFLDDAAMGCVIENLGLSNPLEGRYSFYAVLETHGSVESHDTEKLNSLLENLMTDGVVHDGVVAQDMSQLDALWCVREGVTEALRGDGIVYKYDVSLPLQHLYDLVESMRERTKDSAIRCVGFGHIGDGNLHLNVTSADYNDELLALIEPYIYEFTAGHKGSISAEHGLGLMKAKYINFSQSAEAVHLMQQLKGLMDPKGILNPYKTVI